MIRGLYTAATSMQVQMNKMDVITNNMANADTIGYKKDAMVQSSFSNELAKRIEKVGDTKIGVMSVGVGTSNIVTDFEQGNSKNTGGMLDVALEGDGFLVVQTAKGERYTRCGNLSLTNKGELIDSNGNFVLDANNNKIELTSGNVIIEPNGRISLNGETVATLKLVNFEDLRYMKKEGEGLFSKLNGAVEKEFDGTVRQGFTEGSNVNIVREMVNMISLNRNYEANQKVIQTHDSLMDKAVNDIGRL